mgnify:CR=1 FL=1
MHAALSVVSDSVGDKVSVLVDAGLDILLRLRLGLGLSQTCHGFISRRHEVRVLHVYLHLLGRLGQGFSLRLRLVLLRLRLCLCRAVPDEHRHERLPLVVGQHPTDGRQRLSRYLRVEGGALLVMKDGNLEALNLDFIVRIREYPRNKNGKKKSVILD